MNSSTAADPTTLLTAAAFAAEKHRHQRRKDAEASPFINHPLNVATVLAVEGGVDDASVLVAALLHDTVEDTETTFEELEETFGTAVRYLVAEVSDDISLPRQVRKRLQVESAPDSSPLAKQLKIADKICNVRDIATKPPAGWPENRKVEYLDWTLEVVAGCRGVNSRLDAAYDVALAEGRRKLGLDDEAGP
jgi:guanosine-3',5'-bis(diphosphate) 3'-pyrophosphohydrolase